MALALVIFALVSLVSGLSVESGCPTACFCDDNGEYVSCVGEGPWEVPASVPRTAVRLELRNYQIPTLSRKDLDGMVALQELKLQQTTIRAIENATFVDMAMLQRLELSENLLENLTSSTFEGLSRLRFLDLSSNQLVNIDEAFAELGNVEQLNLRANRIPQLTGRTFTGLHKVQYLNLDANHISTIEVGAFQYLTNLAHLILSNNPLTKLSRLDFFGSRLQYIDVSNIGMERIPQSLTRFVRDLRLARNNLSHISAGDFDSYPYLGLLVLDDNQITEIESDSLGRQEYLMRLWLNGNKLSKIPANLPPSLQALYIEENLLQSIHRYAFKGLFKLEQLFLQRNQIKELETCAFCDLVNLKSLDLQANRIENLTEGIFANLSSLLTLDLSQNNLKVLEPKCFSGLDKLKTLQMSRLAYALRFQESVFDALKSLQTLEMYDSSAFVHQIVNSTRVLHSLRGLMELNIMHNKLAQLRPDFPSFFPQLKNVKMTGNNWYCDKNILWLATWIKTSSVQFYRSYSIRCALPEQFQYKPIMLLTDDDFAQMTTTTTTTTTPTTASLRSGNSSSDATMPPFASLIPVFQTIYLVRTEQPASTKVSKPADRSENITKLDLTSSTTVPNSTTSSPTTQAQTTERQLQVVSNTSIEQQPETNATAVLYAEEGSNNLTEAQTTTQATSNETKASEGSQSVRGMTLPILTAQEHPLSRFIKDRGSTSLASVQGFPPKRLKDVFIAPVLHAHRAPAGHRWDQTTAIVVSSSLVGGCLLVLGAIIVISGTYKCKQSCCFGGKAATCQVRRSSSISYCPQRDEISIVTVSEGTVGLQTGTHHGLGNKLYYVMAENECDPMKEALPDAQLQELLLKEPNGFVADGKYIVK